MWLFFRSSALISGFLLTCAQQQQRGSREVQDTGSDSGRTLLPLPAACDADI